VKYKDEKLESEALASLRGIFVRACLRVLKAHREGDDIVSSEGIRFPMLREGHSMADFYQVNGENPLGLFAVTAVGERQSGLVAHAAVVTLVEAGSAWLSREIRAQIPEDIKLIMPGAGFPSLPDHSLKRDILALLPDTLGITLTESAAMIPEESICGLAIMHKYARYHDIRHIDSAQADDYARRRHFSEDEKGLFLNHLYF